MRWDDAAHSEVCDASRRNAPSASDASECAASSQRHELYTVHYLFYKTGLNFHSPQDLILENVCNRSISTAFDFDMAASRLNILKNMSEVVLKFFEM